MKLSMSYAISIAVIVLSCNNGSGYEQASNKKAAVGLEAETSAVTDKKTALTGTVDDENDLTNADTVANPATPSSDVFQSGSPALTDWDKKIIKTANITLELKDYSTYNASLHARAKVFGAYVAQENQTETDDRITNVVSIKVPVDKFDELVNSFAGENTKLVEKNIATEDVTGEVVDTRARLAAKKQVRDRYLELLKQAKNMNEILQVQSEINTIQEDIESASGRVNYLVHASAYSTINLTYYQFKNGVTQKDIEPSFFTSLAKAFGRGLTFISDFILFIVSIWPLVIAIFIALFYFKRLKLKKA